MQNVVQKIQEEYVFFDGAMGTFLQKNGLKPGTAPEELNISNRNLIEDIHLRYLIAGSDIITVNTFGGNRLKLEEAGVDYKQAISSGVACAKASIESYRNMSEDNKSKEKYIALDLGPIGKLIEPMGTLKFDQAYDLYKEQIIVGDKAGCDLILFETQTDLYELKAGILAAKENSNLPIFVTMTLDASGRTFSGTDIDSMVTFLNDIGIDAMGLNCSFGPKEMLPFVERIVGLSKLPVMVQPNAGLPLIKDGKTVYDLSAEEFSVVMKEMADLGVRILGGCCGTNDEFISKTINLVKENPISKVTPEVTTKVSSATSAVEIGKSVKVIGERLNPTGKKKLKEALRNNDIEYILKEGLKQVEQRADILDVNVGLPDIDESQMMIKVIKEIQSIIDVPLQIDSSSVKALESGARYYNGKPLINSVSGKDESLDAILPIVKKYGCCVLGLTLDDRGIPSSAEDRYKIAEKIVKKAGDFGIPKENVLIDCLVLTASAQQKEVKETLKAVSLVKKKLGVKTVLGVSNVSFGLPNRDLINRTFLAMAINSGLDAPIMNPGSKSMMGVIDVSKVLYNDDVASEKYIDLYSDVVIKESHNSKGSSENKPSEKNSSSEYSLGDIIAKGLKNEAKAVATKLLETKKPLDIINEEVVPALDIAGVRFEKQEIFLPQLIKSAETVNEAFLILKAEILKDDKEVVDSGSIVLATVKNDIHDIGKNIVKVILQSYGFNVVDLGKDVNPEVVLQTCLDKNIKLVGLSALMTTTVTTMEETIKLLKENIDDVKIIVGGAVLTKEYADMIGADFYCKDAKETALVVKEFYQ